MNTVRKLRALGAAVLAVLAIGGVSASAAQAGVFETGVSPAIVTGQHINGPHEITTNLGVMACGVRYEGELAAASEELTVTPEFGNCMIAGIPVVVTPNGCDFRFHAGATLGFDMVEGSWDVICPEGAKIDFEIQAMVPCHLGVPEQVGLGEVTFRNTTMGAQDADVEFNVEGMNYELGPNCPGAGGAFANGEYAGESTLRAHSEGAGTPFGVK